VNDRFLMALCSAVLSLCLLLLQSFKTIELVDSRYRSSGRTGPLVRQTWSLSTMTSIDRDSMSRVSGSLPLLGGSGFSLSIRLLPSPVVSPSLDFRVSRVFHMSPDLRSQIHQVFKGFVFGPSEQFTFVSVEQ
jgi:hypothetical protein